jgi:hypothetical protein
MKLKDALTQMATLMVENDQLQREAISDHPYSPGTPVTPEVLQISERLSVLDRSITRFSERCAADPGLHPHMICWMVDIEGVSDASPTYPITDAAMASHLVDMITDPTGFAAKQGSMMLNVRTCLEQNGFKILDHGGGCGQWHIGVPCDEALAELVSQLLFNTFGSAIESKMISVRRRFWRWRFKALYDASQAYEHLGISPL